MTVAIDLANFTSGGKVKNLSGKDRGKAAREEFRLDKLDHQADQVEVKIPKNVYAISTSFFCGMFERSYKNLGGPEQLCEVYKFNISDELQPQIDQGLRRCASQFEPFMKSRR